MRPTAAGELELAPTISTSNAVLARKRARLRRQRRAAARKALCVFVSVVLVVGLMPGIVAWGNTNASQQADFTEVQDVNDGEPANQENQPEGNTPQNDDTDENSGNPDGDDDGIEDGNDEVVILEDEDLPIEQPFIEAADGKANLSLTRLEEAQGAEAIEEKPEGLLVESGDEPSEMVSVQSAMSTQASSYSIELYINSGYYVRSDSKAQGAASGDKITVTMDNTRTNTLRNWYLWYYLDGAAQGKNDHKYSTAKNSTSSEVITVPTGYKYSKIVGGQQRYQIYFTKLPTYQLRLDYNGGKISSATSYSQTAFQGYATTINKSPSRSGMAFSGWNTRADGSGTHYNNNSSVTFYSDTTLYAEWTRAATFTPGAYGSSNVSSATIYYNSSGTGYLNRTTSTSQSVQLTGVGGWTPAGWATSRKTQAKARDATFNLTGSVLTSASTTNFYSILSREVSLTYDANGADAATSKVPKAETFTQVNYGGNYGTTSVSTSIKREPANLEKAGYEFDGWEINGTPYQPGDTYTWSSADADAAVTAKAIWVVSTLIPNDVTVSLADWTYGDDPNTPSVTASYNASGAEISYATNASGPYTTTVPTQAGTYYVQASIAKDRTAGYQKGQAVSTFTIHPKTVGLDWSNTSFTYDGNSHVPTATATGLVVGDTCTVTVAGAQTNGGTHTAWAQSLDNPNYALPTSATCPFTISPIALKVKANDHTITYGDVPAGNGVTYVGLLAADDAGGGTPKSGVLGGTLGYTYTYSQYGDVGDYQVTPTGLSSPNYNITYEAGKLTVDKREVTLTWSTPDSFTYTGSNISWPAPTVGNLVSSDTVNAVWATGSGANVDTATAVGNYTPSVGSLSGTKAKNYKLPTTGLQGTWHITAPPTNTMTVSIAGWTYGQWTSANKPVVTAEHGASTATFEYYTDAGCTTVVPSSNRDSNGYPKDAGTYYVKATIAEVSGSYPGASATCGFTISRAPITVTADDLQTKLNQPQATLTYTVAPGLASWDSLTGIVAVAADSTNPIDTTKTGSYNIKMGWASGYSAASLPNYIVTLVDGTYTVTRGDATVSAAGYNGTYDGVADTEHITVSATDSNVTIYYSDTNDFATLIGGGTLNTLQTATSTEDAGFETAWTALQTALSTASYTTNAADYTYKDAGTYTVYFLAVGKDVKTDVIVGSKQVVINKAPLTVTANPKSIQYGEAADNDGVTYSGFVSGETETSLRALSPAELSPASDSDLTYTYGTYAAGSAPGMYPIAVSGLTAKNYDITYVPGTLTVGPKELGIAWPTPASFEYSGSSQNYGPATLTGVPSGASVSLVMGGTTSATNAGSYIATVTGLTGSDAALYTLPSTGLTHTWNITKADLTITANNNEITYGDAPAANGVTYSPAAGAGSVSGSLSFAYDYNQYDAVGDSYKITPSGLASSNYNITYADGTLKVKPRELTLTWPVPDSLPWTGAELTYGEPTLGNIVNGDDVSVDGYSGNKGTNGGSYTAQVDSIKGDKAGNYKLPSAVTHGWDIYGAANSVTVSISNWTYGDPAQTPSATDVGGVNSYTFEYSENSTGPWSTTVPTNAGTYYVRATVPASGIYAQSYGVASFEIYQRVIGLTWTNLAFVYDETSHVPTATATGLIGIDVCNVTVKGAKTDSGLYTATASKLDNDNYALPASVTQLFTIAPVALTITANDNTITYGDAPSGSGVTYVGLLAGDKDANGDPVAGILTGTLMYTYTYNQYDDVGTYSLTPTGLSSTNYAITYAPGTLTVNKRPVTFVWSTPSTFNYTGSAITWPEPTVNNLVNGDVVTADWATPAGTADVYTATNMGDYAPVVGSLSGAKAGNYTLPTAVADRTGSWKIDVPAIAANTMTVSMADWTYGKYSAAANGPFVTADYGASTATFTYYEDDNGAPGTTPLTGADLQGGVPKNVGKYWVKAEIAANSSGGYSAATAQASFEITKANITVTADDQVAVRNDTGIINTLTCTISGDVASWDSLSSYFEATSDSTKAINPAIADIYLIKAGWASGYNDNSLSNYNVTFVSGTYTVTRAIANVSASGYTGTYDGVADNEHITVSVTDSETGTTYSGTATNTIGSGPGTITVYYSESDFATDATISGALATVQSEADISGSTFTSAWSTLQSAITTGGYKNSYLDSDFVYKNAGTHRVYFMVVSDQTSPDVITGYQDVVINKAPLTVTAGNKSIALGEAAANGGYTITGFVNGETESALRTTVPVELSGTVVYGFGSYTTGSPMGNYPITPLGLTATNYNISYVPGVLSVGGIPLTLQWSSNDSFTYNGAAQTYDSPTLVGVATGDNVQLVLTTSTFTATNGGTYTATVAGLAGANAAKYTFASTTSLSHNWTINPAPLTVTAKPNSITYGDAPAGDGVTYSGLLDVDKDSNGDPNPGVLTGSLSYTFGYTQCGDVGTYTGAITPGGLASPNYTISYVAGDLTVTKRQLTLVWPTPDEIDYSGMVITYPEPTLGNIVNSDSVGIDEYEGNQQTAVGDYTAEVKSFLGMKLGNYELPPESDWTHPWKIKGADNNATVSIEDWTYGDTPSDPSVTADFGDSTATFGYSVYPTGPFSSVVPTLAGTYYIKATIPAGDAYNGAEATASFQVKKRPLKVTAVAQGVALGEPIATGTDQVTTDNLATDDELVDVTLTSDPETPATTPTFTGKITPSAAVIQNADGDDMTRNYDITYEDALMVIQPGATIANGKVIWAMNRVILMSVAEATDLCDADDRDDQIIALADAHSCFTDKLPTPTWPDDELGINIIDDGGFEPVVGTYSLTLKANPELGVTAIVYDNAEVNPDPDDPDPDNPTKYVKVFANDITPPRSVLRAAKAGDTDAIARLIQLAGATAVDQDGNTIPVTSVDLSDVDPENPDTYRAVYSTDGGASAKANVTVPEEDDEAEDPDDGPDGPGGGDDPDNPDDPDDPKDELEKKIEEAEDIVGPVDPDNPTDEEKKLLEEIEEAKKIIDDPDATPEQIRDAIKRLDDAIAALKAARGESGAAGALAGNKVRPASRNGLPLTGDQMGQLALISLAIAAAALFAMRASRRQGRHARK